MSFMRASVLTYHCLRAGNGYAQNDHVALAQDLAVVAACGLTVTSVRKIVEHVRWGLHPALKGERCVAFSFDDGADYDVRDYAAPDGERTLSFASILAAGLTQPEPPEPGTSFVIVGSQARADLDRNVLGGGGNWSSGWWRSAQERGSLDIGNHSWDHNHELVQCDASRSAGRGSFLLVDNWREADYQILQAADTLDAVVPSHSRLFAYPYGEYNTFLLNEYFPRHESRFLGALSTDPGVIHSGSNIWCLPRYVCGHHWCDPDELGKLLSSM